MKVIDDVKKKKVNPRTMKHVFYAVEYRNPQTGKVVFKRGFLSKTDAKQWYRGQLASIQSSEKIEDILFSEAAEKWLDNKRHLVSGATYSKYKSMYNNHLTNHFKHKRLSEISVQDCQKLVYELADKYLRWDKIIQVFSSVFDFSIKRGNVNSNPFKKVDRPRVQVKDQHVLTAEQFSVLKKAIKEHYGETNHKAYTLLMLLAVTGMRKGEVLGLKWDNIDFEACYIKVVNAVSRDYNNHIIENDSPKNKYSIRKVPIGNATARMLKDWKAEQESELLFNNVNNPNNLVFTNVAGGILTTSKPGKWLNVITKKYNLPQVTVHDLRRTYATLLAGANIPATKIAKNLGHRDTTITNKIYIKLQEDLTHETSDVIESI